MFGFIKSLLGFKGNFVGRREIVVDISELAPIWQKYNQSFTPIRLDENEADSSLNPSGKNQVEERDDGKAPANQKAPAFFGQEAVREFYDPYRPIFESQKASEGFLKLIEFLDRYGNCPSIVDVKGDSEGDELYSIKDVLVRVPLREHCIHVAREMLKLLKETYRDYEEMIPIGLVVSFGHDIGKVPMLREDGFYSKADHPVLSEMKLKEIFQGNEPHWFQKAIEIVKDHHGRIKEQFGLLFITADSRAREIEITSFDSGLKIKAWDEWFDVKRLIEMVLPDVNVLKGQNKWDALSHGSYVYLQPDLVYNSARKLCEEKKVVDMRLLKISNKQEVIKKAVESMRKVGILSPDLGETMWGRWYEVKSQWLSKKMFLIPVKIDCFGVLPHVIEARKEGYLETIEKIIITER